MGMCSRHAAKQTATRRRRSDAKEGVYDRMNNIAAQVLLDVTSSMRFGRWGACACMCMYVLIM